MFRLFKLAAYAFVGFAFYEFIAGYLEGRPSERSQRRGIEDGSNEPGAQAKLTGTGHDTRQTTHDANGGSTAQRVGRGVRSHRGF